MISRKVLVTKIPSGIVLEGLLEFKSKKRCRDCHGKGIIRVKAPKEKEFTEKKCGCVKIICPLCKSKVLLPANEKDFVCSHCGIMQLSRPKQAKSQHNPGVVGSDHPHNAPQQGKIITSI